jgi:hypothetical protein
VPDVSITPDDITARDDIISLMMAQTMHTTREEMNRFSLNFVWTLCH